MYHNMKIVDYVDIAGRSPFARWFSDLDAVSAAKITVVLKRLEAGNVSNVKSVGGGVFEFRIDWGAGYCIYFGRDGDEWIILLAGGTKRRQQRDIENAKACWADYKARKKEAR